MMTIGVKFGKKWQDIIKDGARSLNVYPEEGALTVFSLHATELIRWNRKMNLTAITDPLEVAIKHFVDSIALVPYLPETGKILDLGSGGGFPGLPLKIVRPSLDLTMVDASRKRVSFLKNFIRLSGISNVNAIHARGEELCRANGFSHAFDFVVSRAFTSLNKFVAMAEPFIKKNGCILAMKGKVDNVETDAVLDEKWQVQTMSYQLPFGDHERSIVIVTHPGSLSVD